MGSTLTGSGASSPAFLRLLRVSVAVMAAVQTLVVYPLQVWSQKFLFADASLFFLNRLEYRAISGWDWSRQFSHTITQFPLYAAMAWWDLRDINFLAASYGAMLHLMPLLGAVIPPLLLARSSRPCYAFPPLLSAWYLSVNTALFVISESLTAITMFWITYALILRFRDRPGYARGIPLVALSFLGLRCYEAYALFGSILLGFSWSILRDEGRAMPRVARRLFIAAAALQLGSALIGARGLLFPRSAHNLINVFYTAVGQSWQSNLALFSSTAALLLAGWGAWRLSLPPAADRRLRPALVAALLALCLPPLLPPLFELYFDPWKHSYLRILNILAPALLGGAALWLWRSGARQPGAEQPGARRRGPRRPAVLARGPAPGLLLLATVLLFAWNVALQLHASFAFGEFRRATTRALDGGRGMMDVTGTPLAGMGYAWAWTLPSTSILISAMDNGPVIRSIVTCRTAMRFGPRRFSAIDRFPDLRHYGISYDTAAFFGPPVAGASTPPSHDRTHEPGDTP